MNHETIIRHLSYYANLMIKDLGAKSARGYLSQCITLWHECYGEAVATEMRMTIEKLLQDHGVSFY